MKTHEEAIKNIRTKNDEVDTILKAVNEAANKF